jgi:type I restriction enzyme, S subunit
LTEIADESGGEIRTGPFGSQLHRHDYTDVAGGVPVVMPLNMAGGRIDAGGIAKITPAKAFEMSAHITHPGDVLLSRRGDIGRYCLVDAANAGALCGTGSLRVSIQGSSLMPEYLCFYL